MSFDLRSLVTEELDTSGVADPYILTEFACKRIDDGDLREALEMAMPCFVRHVMAAGRSNRSSRLGDVTPDRLPRKVAAYIEKYCIATSTGDRSWKFLADCTRDDILVAVEIREQAAAATLAEAARLRSLADLMAKHKAATVRDLSPELIAEALR